ncbi:beta-lactamase-like protein [Haematococcus lacustris]
MDALFAAPGQRGRALESEAPCPPTSTSASPCCQPAPGFAPTLPHASTQQQPPVASRVADAPVSVSGAKGNRWAAQRLKAHLSCTGQGCAALKGEVADGRGRVTLPTVATPAPAAQAALLFLGTGSAEPSKYRSASGILLRCPGGQGSLLMDCGEGSWGQLLRWLGQESADALLADLRCVWISHKHADHCLGLAQLLEARPQSLPPLLVVGPRAVQHWLQHLHHNHGLQSRYLHCRDLCSRPSSSQSLQTQLLGVSGLGLSSWSTVPVIHCHEAYGLVLEHESGWKLVYSGDTRPCPALIGAGQGATLLIHEATFEPNLLQQATTKRHSTTSEAMLVARQMKASHTILTHFSQRYPKLPVPIDVEEVERSPVDATCKSTATNTHSDSTNATLAFDGMLVPFNMLGTALQAITWNVANLCL